MEKGRTKAAIKPFLFGFVVGVVAILIIIFSAGWVVTNKKAEEMAQQAVIERLTEIGIVKFKQDPNKQAKLEQLKEKSAWEREDYVAEQGWATMPGKKEPNMGVADRLADRLAELQP